MESPAAEDAPAAPLVSDAMAVLCLKAEYVGNANGNFMHGIDALNRRYEGLRRVRGDGNCFFRGFIFALCEQLLPAGDARDEPRVQQLRARVQETIRRSKGELVAIGYSEVAIDAFWETFVDYLAAMETRSHAELGAWWLPAGGWRSTRWLSTDGRRVLCSARLPDRGRRVRVPCAARRGVSSTSRSWDSP